MTAPPLILTLELDGASASFFDGQRRRFFPPERNLIPAHVTLFHKLPGAHEAAIGRDLAAVAASRSGFGIAVEGLRLLGRGVAYRLAAPEWAGLRGELSRRWADWLSPQDQANIAPHVTVQNKVDPAAARALFDELSAGFMPFEARATGLLLWAYLGGPWAPRGRWAFPAA